MLFNFQDADIQAVIKTVSQLTGRNFLIDPRVKGKVTILSVRPVSKFAAYDILLSSLRAQGFTAVEGSRGITRIIPEAEGKHNAPASRDRLGRVNDQWVSHVFVVQNASAAHLVPILRPLMAPNAQIAVYAPANVLVITDYASNVQNMLDLIERIDQPAAADVTIIPLKHASALDIAQLVSRLDTVVAVPGQPMPQAGPEARLNIVPDARTNSLLVRSDNPGRVEQLRALVEKLDVEPRAGGNTRVVYLQNAEAAKLAEVLRGVIAGEARAAAAPAPGAAASAPGARAAEGSLVQADEATNALIISASDAVYNNLRSVIDKLDVRRAQVYVEALIAEVSSDKAAQFGIQWAGGKAAGSGGALVGATNFPRAGSGLLQTAIAPESLATAGGLTLGYLSGKITLPDGREVLGLGALARALEEDSKSNILSTPNILTLDNAEAKIIIGQNVPFLTGSYAQSTGTSGAAVNPFQTIERKDVGLTLKIKPQISEGGGVKMHIYQEVSSVARANLAAQDLITNKRSIETTVIVDDGSIVVLGGLIEDRVSESIQEVPLLSKIPLLGELFKYRERSTTKTNLMVFLRPAIVRSARDTVGFTEYNYKYMRDQQKEPDRSSLFFGGFNPPVMPESTATPFKREVKPDAGAKETGQAPPAEDRLLGPPQVGPDQPAKP
ncbi:MAG: type II secretion system protein GspD [Candidatus Muproteobacteria bacterium RBG_16_65_34]|uniref:Type II secretion system protein GspD n=1 Tax=Candidatus Muproteobacteria bacterium RBG_16_65_34 TaxID=1817760 RepID=A0A1F6TQ20_9PROT|nr:MAG: type II secretion system protein GspD [Candidatus Muproteobacteria bacterium RBG_16_65_34]